jgi:hypothetical protein
MVEVIPELYRAHYVDKSDERLGLFVLLKDLFSIRSALYPGSFTHLTPSFVFPITCFVDTDRRAQRFFQDPAVLELATRRKSYQAAPIIRFHHADYSQGFDEPPGTFDLLISQYAGFVSRACKRYLRVGAYLVANTSHGDAAMASIDDDYELVGVIRRRGEWFRWIMSDLEPYLTPKKDVAVTVDHLERTRRGVAYKKSAFSYVFQRIA